MNAALRRGVVSGIFAGGFVLLGVTTATSASADTGDPGLALAGSTHGSDGVGSGNQTDIDLDAPLRAVGNQVTVVGKDNQNHSTTAGAPAAPSPRPTPTGGDTSGEDGVLSGNQTTVAACVPITADGNQVTVVGDGNHGTSGGSHDACESVTLGEADESSGDEGVASGNQTSVEVCVPVTLSGNQLTGVGDGNHASSEESGAACGTGERTSDQTSGEDGLLSGNQTSLDVCIPVTATGNQLTVIGDDNQSSSSRGGSSCGEGAAGGGTPGDTSGEDGLGSGNQTALDPNVPVDVIGNQVTVIGEGNSNESTSSGAGAGAGGGAGDTSGEDGTGSGNQTVVVPSVPVDAVGNQVTVIGEGNSNESTSSGAGAVPGGGTGDTSGEDGTGSGNQTVVDSSVPVDAVGNQVTVIGEGNSNESTSSGAGAGAGGGAGDTSGEDALGSGNQTVVDSSVPVDAVGNQVTVIGEGNSNESTSSGAGAGAGGGAGDTSGEDGTGSGNQTVVDPSVPVEVEANQVTVIGADNTNDSTEEGPGEDPGDDPGEDPNDPGEDPGDGNGDGGGDGPGEGPGGQDGGDGSPGDTDVMPGQARAGALVAAPRAPSEVQAGLHATAPTTTSPSSPVLPLLMLLLGALCVALAGRRLSVGRT